MAQNLESRPREDLASREGVLFLKPFFCGMLESGRNQNGL
jgi:hypothetical protein